MVNTANKNGANCSKALSINPMDTARTPAARIPPNQIERNILLNQCNENS